MKKSFIWMSILLSGFLILLEMGCNSNPYPDGQYTDQRPPSIKIEKNYVINAPSSVRVSEGAKTQFTVSGTVPPPGKPIITFDGLPTGAVYSTTDQTITWTPDYNAAHDPNDPTSTSKTYEVTITLQSSLDEKTVQTQTDVITVTKTARLFKIVSFNAQDYLSEGTPYETVATVQDDEYPKGPFTISQNGAPAGVQLSPDALHPEQIKVKFAPNYGLVDSNFTSQNYNGPEHFTWTMYIANPSGRILSVPVDWQISDTRLDPQYIGPDTLSTKSQDVSFVATLRDPNLEIEPTVTVDSASVGTLDVTRLAGNGPDGTGIVPTQTAYVRWSNIPVSEAGKTENIALHICVYSQQHVVEQCTAKVISVTFAFSAPAPTPAPTPIPTATPQPRPSPTPTGGFL